MFFSRILAVATLLCATAMPARATTGYEIAFTPFLPVRTLLQNYAPMREFLESELKEAVTLVSAPDYRTDYARIANREYAFVITVAHSAYLAQTDHGYVPQLRPLIPTRPTLVVRKENPAIVVKDLSGGVIAMSDPLAVVSMQGMQMLRDAGLRPALDVQVIHQANHVAAVSMVLAGAAAGAIISDRALLQMTPEIQAQVRKLAVYEKGAAPGVIYMANGAVPLERRERLRKAILKFANDTAEGRAVMERMGYGGLAPVTARDLRMLKPYGARLRVALQSR